MRDLDEPILPDDYPIYAGYLYIVDGKLHVSDFHDVTVLYLKRKLGANEVRRCDIYGRKEIMDKERVAK